MQLQNQAPLSCGRPPTRESDKILTLLTQEADGSPPPPGAAGEREPHRRGQPVAGMVRCGAARVPGRWTVQEAAVDREFRGMREDLEKFSLGCYFAEVTELLAVEGLPLSGAALPCC